MKPLILASTSTYRKELLERLQIPFTQESPDFEEIPENGEAPLDIVMRFAREKVLSVQKNLDRPSLIIGSDQIAILEDQSIDESVGHILNKPLTHERATAQLMQCSGRTVTFYTAVCVLNSSSQTIQSSVDEYRVRFRHLTAGEIDSYLHKETPYDCAGSFKAEGLGIALFAEMTGKDPTALIGLPLISLLTMLRKEGIQPLN